MNKNACDGIYDSMDVRFTKNCDNRCPFCIEKQGLPSFGMPDIKKMIDNTITRGIKDVLILGGEPFLYPEQLLEYMKGIRSYADKIYLTTSLPWSIESDSDSALRVIKLLDGLNVSLQSTDWQENNKLMNSSSCHNRIKILESLIYIFGDKIRVSINLVKGGIDNKGKIEKVLSDLEHIGCKYIKINELQNQSDLYVSFEKIMGVKYSSPYATGCSTFIKLKGITMKILLKRSCFLTENSLKASLLDLLKSIFKVFYTKKNKFSVLYENGNLEKGWITCSQK